MRGLGI